MGTLREVSRAICDSVEAMTLSEMKERFHGQWVAVRVTERDDGGQPVAGEVLAVKPSRLEVAEAVREERDVCLLYAGEPIPEGYGALY